MPGLDATLDQVNSTTDEFLNGTLGADPIAQGFTRPGRFNLAGLVALLSLGATDREREAPAPRDLVTANAALAKAALDKAGSPVTIEEAEDLLTLLRTGAVTADLVYSLEAALKFVRQLPPDLFRDVLNAHALPWDVVEAMRDDFAGHLPRRPEAFLVQLRDGRLDRAVLPNTLRVLKKRAVPRDAAETLRALIAPKNRMVRLAILIYARTQGVDIDERDLDAVYRAIDPANSDLAPLLNRGLARVQRQYPVARDAVTVLRRLTPEMTPSPSASSARERAGGPFARMRAS